MKKLKKHHEENKKLYGDGYKRNFVTDRLERNRDILMEVDDFVNVKLNGIIYLGMCNIGHNPTYNFSEGRRMEVNIFNLDEDIYGEEIEVFFVERIRSEHKFNNVDELRLQLIHDKEECLKLASSVNYTK